MTYLFATAMLLTLFVIWVNTYRNALPSRPMGRLLKDPEAARNSRPRWQP
jgi:hypothetical protein